MNFNIKIITFNVNGLKDKANRNNFVQLFQYTKFNILFLQETYMTAQNEEKYFETLLDCKCISFIGSSYSNGVSILISKKIFCK